MKIIITIILLLSITGIRAQQSLSSGVNTENLRHSLYILASDSLSGRFPGSHGDIAAAGLIASAFRTSGLTLYQGDGFQRFEVLTRQETGNTNMLKIDGKKYRLNSDFAPFPFSENGEAAGSLVFAGYGLEVRTDSFQWNDYHLDVKGKIVLLLRGTPGIDKYEALFDNYSDDIVKAITARDKGAVAVILVSAGNSGQAGNFPQMNLRESSAGIPVFQITKDMADKLLKSEGLTIDKLNKQFQQQDRNVSVELKHQVSLNSDIRKIKSSTANVIGYVYPSDSSDVHGNIVIGAHSDHLGMGGKGSSSRLQDSVAVHNGADDNASGVSLLLELAAHFQKERDKLKYNLVFVAFGAEEMGIVGSKFFMEHPPVPPSSIKAMINLDMVGRLKEDTMLQVTGVGTSREAVALLNDINRKHNFKLRLGPEGYGPSDHAAFYAKNIPVFCLSTGAHTDYHTPYDDREKIDFEGMRRIGLFTEDLIGALAFSTPRLTFQEAGPQQGTGPGRRFRVTLGLMPDINATTDNGLLVEFVTKGKPAYNGGMKNGDIITSVDGKPVKNIQDYMVRLSQLKAGQSVNVEILRNNRKELLIIQL